METVTIAKRKPFKRIYRLGTGPSGSIFVKAELDAEGELHLIGVEGPTSGGNARGSCGQIVDHIEISKFAKGWTPALVSRLQEIWNGWHLNHMRAGCVHQRAWDVSEKLEIVTYRLTSETIRSQNALKERFEKELSRGQTVSPLPGESALLALPYTTTQAPDADSFASGCYEVKERKTERAGWVYPKDHERGLLCKPCPECGYKYGSAWLKEEVPDAVLNELLAMPEADTQPEWI